MLSYLSWYGSYVLVYTITSKWFLMLRLEEYKTMEIS